MSTVLRLRMSPSPPRLKVDGCSPTNQKMDSPCATPSQHLSIRPTLCPCLCLCRSVSLFESLSAFVSPGVCLCLSVSLSVPASVSVSIYSRVCAPASVVSLSAKLDMIAGISCGRRCNRCVADAHFCCNCRSKHKLKKDIPT